jgi:hypothetical protein
MILREIPFEIHDLLREYNEDVTDERRAEIEAQLDSLEIEFSRKADSIADLIAGHEAQARFIDDEIARLELLKKQREKQAEGWRRYLHNAIMRQTGGATLETAYHKFSFRTSHALHIDDDASIPIQFCREIPARLEPQKQLIKDAIRRGESIEGVSLEPRVKLQIK